MKDGTVQVNLWGRLRAIISADTFPGVLLVLLALVALVLANSPLAENYFSWWQAEIKLGTWDIGLTCGEFINDALMAVFFLMIGLEIKREILVGELSSVKKAAFPVVAALGGMLIPALIYIIFNFSSADGSVSGFGIPMATDIAFALGVLLLLGKRVPVALKVLLLSLAVADDLGAIIIIAVFYTTSLSWTYLLAAGATLLVLFVLNRLGVRSLVPYILLGLVVWFCFLHSGVHATIAGVLVALTVPFGMRLSAKQFAAKGAPVMGSFEHNEDVTHSQLAETLDKKSPLVHLQNGLHKPVYLFILPLFALANAGVAFGGEGINLFSPVALGIMLGLLIGKPMGIMGFTWLACRLRFLEKPKSLHWQQIGGMSMLGGIGFTMSIFITYLAFSDAAHVDSAKLAILIGSLIAGIIGTVYMLRITKKPHKKKAVTHSHEAEETAV